MAAKKSPTRRNPGPPKPPKPGSSIGKAVGKMVSPGSFAQANPVPPKTTPPATGGQRRGAPRPEEYPRDNPDYPKTPGRVYPPGTPYKPRYPEPGRPKPGVVPPKRKPPVTTTTTTVPKTPGLAQPLLKKKKGK